MTQAFRTLDVTKIYWSDVTSVHEPSLSRTKPSAKTLSIFETLMGCYSPTKFKFWNRLLKLRRFDERTSTAMEELLEIFFGVSLGQCSRTFTYQELTLPRKRSWFFLRRRMQHWKNLDKDPSPRSRRCCWHHVWSNHRFLPSTLLEMNNIGEDQRRLAHFAAFFVTKNILYILPTRKCILEVVVGCQNVLK